MFPLALLALFYLIVVLLKTRKVVYSAKYQQLPPSPPKLPLIGNLHQVGNISQDSIHALSMKYGPLMLLHLGQIPTLIVSSAEMAQEVMKNQDNVYASRPSMKASKLLLYKNKTVGFAPYGEYWKHAKKLAIVHLLGVSKVKSYELARKEEVQSAVEKIRHAQSLSNPVDLSEVFSSFTLDILCRVVSKNFSKKHLLRGLIEEGTALFGEFNFEDYFPALHVFDNLLKFDSKAKDISKQWDDLLEQVITEHLNRHEKDGDFIDVLLSLQADKQADFELTKDHIKAILVDMFGAGSHTTFITLEWVMAELVKDQKTMLTLQQEVRTMSGNKSGTIAEEDLKKMTWLKAVIKETLRLHPPAPLLVPRESLEESQINGYNVPKGTKVLINAWTINRDPKFWQNPDKFIPERFVENTGIDFRGNNFQLIPFGGGRRICPGINFAISNIEIMIATILFHFDWELPCGIKRDEFDMNYAPGLTVRRNKKLYLVPREVCHTF
ncbi:Cytochrome P450 [Rhynchospora pubera]|uniref:Cytochrome P450 n=1 Tax=Rhynchospora pubera TaxID=906938 RepID=A0AAV8GGD1_9POAL|nr:Cytochrome P450 [Rhynchospora pubera]